LTAAIHLLRLGATFEHIQTLRAASSSVTEELRHINSLATATARKRYGARPAGA
jgi:hypothetical protein